MSAPYIPQYTERQNRSLKRIAESLTSAHSRTKSCYQHLRASDRKDFQNQILVCATSPSHPEPSPAHPTTFPAWAYNLSQGGIGFVTLNEIFQTNVSIGIRTPEGGIRWLNGRVVRVRPIPEEDFIDYGVAFQSRNLPAREGKQHQGFAC